MLSSLSNFCEMLEKRQFLQCGLFIPTCKRNYVSEKLFQPDYVGTCQNQYYHIPKLIYIYLQNPKLQK